MRPSNLAVPLNAVVAHPPRMLPLDATECERAAYNPPSMEGWHWLVGGMLLLVIELATPSGFFIMFFGLGALTVGLLMWAGLVSGTALEWLLFTGFSLLYLALFRRRIQARLDQPAATAIDSLVGDLAVPQQRIDAGAVGRVEVRGSGWSARNLGPMAVEPGQRCRVSRVAGLELGIVPE